MTPEELLEKLAKCAAPKGYYLHADREHCLGTAESLLANAPEDSFVIGGASVYQLLVDACDTAHVTKIDAEYPADTWFPNLDERGWQVVEEEGPYEHEGVSYRYVTYKRVK